MIPMSRSEVDTLKRDECLQLMEQLGGAQLRRGVLLVELKARIKDLLISKEDEQHKPLLGFAQMDKSQPAEKNTPTAVINIREHTRRQLIRKKTGRPYAVVLTERLPQSGLRQARSHDVPGSFINGPRILPLVDPDMIQERVTRRNIQLEEDKLFAQICKPRENSLNAERRPNRKGWKTSR